MSLSRKKDERFFNDVEIVIYRVILEMNPETGEKEADYTQHGRINN